MIDSTGEDAAPTGCRDGEGAGSRQSSEEDRGAQIRYTVSFADPAVGLVG